jgi:hypothetical protein
MTTAASRDPVLIKTSEVAGWPIVGASHWDFVFACVTLGTANIIPEQTRAPASE